MARNPNHGNAARPCRVHVPRHGVDIRFSIVFRDNTGQQIALCRITLLSLLEFSFSNEALLCSIKP